MQAQVHGGWQRFPELAFLQLAVPGEHEYPARSPTQPIGDHHAFGFRHAHPERSGIRLNVRRLDMRMPGQPVQSPERMELLFVHHAERNQYRVQRRRVVAFRGEKQIAPVRSLVQIAQLVQIDPAHDVERAETRADVARPGLRNHVERVDPGERGERARVVDRIQAGASQTHELRHRHIVERIARDDVELLFTHTNSFERFPYPFITKTRSSRSPPFDKLGAGAGGERSRTVLRALRDFVIRRRSNSH